MLYKHFSTLWKKKKEYKKQSQRCKQNPVKVKDILSLVKGNISLKGKRSKIKKKKMNESIINF